MPDVEPPDYTRDLETAVERELLDAAETPPTVWDRLRTFFSGPIGLAIVGFILSGVAATTFSKWLDDLSKTHELELSSQQRATESVKAVTEILYERQIRTRFVEASIRRNASPEELRDRKKYYDDAVIRYNTQLQSNSFRIREMFHGRNYRLFQDILLSDVTGLFRMADACLTSSYDIALSASNTAHQDATKVLTACDQGRNAPPSLDSIQDAIGYCIYAYSDELFNVVQSARGVPFSAELSDAATFKIKERCKVRSEPAAQ